MAEVWHFQPDEGAIRLIGSLPIVRDNVDFRSRAVVADARQRAPKRTTRGAVSIHRELLLADDLWQALISWDPAHAYMKYQELGTRHFRPHSFLRPAFEARASSTR